ncbi:polyprenyl synthetase family protein [Longispora albida]|uniref:polyprenyl synthetase family protein n=1 Tax=Longispora albida TaxID=203523 RepID=UPI00036A4B22|nr:polyprenyl synthetase family protein [Longispora albida]
MTLTGTADPVQLRSRIDAELATFLDRVTPLWPGQSSRLVSSELREYVLAPGKRIRPAFCYWGWRAAGREDCQAITTAAASLELLHASLIAHDDIIDGSDERRGRPALHRTLESIHRRHGWLGNAAGFGVSTAILCGAQLLAWSDEMYRSCGLGAARIAAGYPHLTSMRTEVLGGQFLDLHEQAAGGTLEGAMRVIRYKTASYTVRGPLRMGAAMAGAGDKVVAALDAVGLPLGEAFQLRDDVLGVFGDPAVTGKPNIDDLREGKPTVLIALTRLNARPRQVPEIEALFGDPQLTEAGAARLRQIITESGARDEVEKLIEERAQAARDALAGAPADPVARAVLDGLITTTTRREL